MTAQPLRIDPALILSLAEEGKIRRPDLAARIDRAVEYINADLLDYRQDGTWNVRSMSRDRVYHVNGTCSCADARGKNPATAAPNGLCKHRLACRLLERAYAIEQNRSTLLDNLDRQAATARAQQLEARQELRVAMIKLNKARAAERAAQRGRAQIADADASPIDDLPPRPLDRVALTIPPRPVAPSGETFAAMTDRINAELFA